MSQVSKVSVKKVGVRNYQVKSYDGLVKRIGQGDQACSYYEEQLELTRSGMASAMVYYLMNATDSPITEWTKQEEFGVWCRQVCIDAEIPADKIDNRVRGIKADLKKVNFFKNNGLVSRGGGGSKAKKTDIEKAMELFEKLTGADKMAFITAITAQMGKAVSFKA